ncbi:MAG: cyclic nucleotide-binding domain-containing protein [Deltaproteobacteria bacterium]|nr:cyclic nucleotide-binding domain-containing protein [Deltaproteobacteria bacterium]
MIKLGRYQPGEVIVKENDQGGTAYVIEEGTVEVSKQRDGREVYLAYLEAGE